MKCDQCTNEYDKKDFVNKDQFINICFNCYYKIQMLSSKPEKSGILDLPNNNQKEVE